MKLEEAINLKQGDKVYDVFGNEFEVQGNRRTLVDGIVSDFELIAKQKDDYDNMTLDYRELLLEKSKLSLPFSVWYRSQNFKHSQEAKDVCTQAFLFFSQFVR